MKQQTGKGWMVAAILIAIAGIIYVVVIDDILRDFRVLIALPIFVGVIVAVLLHRRSMKQVQNEQKNKQAHQ